MGLVTGHATETNRTRNFGYNINSEEIIDLLGLHFEKRRPLHFQIRNPISYTLSRQYRMVINQYSLLLFTSADSLNAKLRVQEHSTNMTSQY